MLKMPIFLTLFSLLAFCRAVTTDNGSGNAQNHAVKARMSISGAFAEDFYDAFGTGVIETTDARTHISASDMAGVVLAAIKAMINKLDIVQEDIERLNSQNDILQRRIDSLETIIGH
jgi:hypothetical protein